MLAKTRLATLMLLLAGVPALTTTALRVRNPANAPDDLERAVMQGFVSELGQVSLAPEVAAAIARDYPQDAATGFEPGQLRGAVAVRWPAIP